MAGCNWQHKLRAHKHIGLTVLVKVQRNLSKLALTAGDPDVDKWYFNEGPMVYDENSDLQWAFHLMAFFLKDMNRAIMRQELFNFLEVHQLFMKLYLALAPSNTGSKKTKAMIPKPVTL